MADERDDLRNDLTALKSTHARLLAVCRTWERLVDDLNTEIAQLKGRVIYAETEVETLQTERLAMSRNWGKDIAKLEDARALISWIDGMCVDCADHMEIRAGINRFWRARTGIEDTDG